MVSVTGLAALIGCEWITTFLAATGATGTATGVNLLSLAGVGTVGAALGVVKLFSVAFVATTLLTAGTSVTLAGAATAAAGDATFADVDVGLGAGDVAAAAAAAIGTTAAAGAAAATFAGAVEGEVKEVKAGGVLLMI